MGGSDMILFYLVNPCSLNQPRLTFWVGGTQSYEKGEIYHGLQNGAITVRK